MPVMADSFITSPSCPVRRISPLPGIMFTSTCMVTPPTLVSCFFPYTREGILALVNQEICCDFTHILVTDGIDLDSNTTPLCGAI